MSPRQLQYPFLWESLWGITSLFISTMWTVNNLTFSVQSPQNNVRSAYTVQSTDVTGCTIFQRDLRIFLIYSTIYWIYVNNDFFVFIYLGCESSFPCHKNREPVEDYVSSDEAGRFYPPLVVNGEGPSPLRLIRNDQLLWNHVVHTFFL